MNLVHNVKPKYQAGGTWNARKIEKKNRGSQTPGNKKGLVPPQWARYICRANRSYKHPDYSKWNSTCDGNKIQWSKS